jgi:CMP-N-acetylneuraminate monooxygenase
MPDYPNPSNPSDQQQPREIDLGPTSQFGDIPARIELEGKIFFLICDPVSPAPGSHNANYQLLSNICPHMSGQILDKGDCFECPNHGWQFDRRNGQGLTVPGQRMRRFRVEQRGQRLVAVLPPQVSLHQSDSQETTAKPSEASDVQIQLLAHACFKIEYQGLTMLTDPWLFGPAFLGAWAHYPPTKTPIEDLQADLIWISHEHSDHFHEPTLARFSRNIPVFVPDFPNQRLATRLREMGFGKVTAMTFGQKIKIADQVNLTCFEPANLWNDSVVLMEFGDFRFLNINDAGLNHSIARHVGKVSALASSFSPGASSYPMTWQHLSQETKLQVMGQQRQTMLDMLGQAVAHYQTDTLIPFAGHFALQHPDHRVYAQYSQKNTLNDVVNHFAESDCQVIDLLPGESWHTGNRGSGDIQRVWDDRESLYDPATVLDYLEQSFDPQEFSRYYPTGESIEMDQLRSYFLKFNQVPDIAFCSKLTVDFSLSSKDKPAIKFSLQLQEGRMGFCEGHAPADNEPWLGIELPVEIAARIIKQNLSWDEAHIGYWCKLDRRPDMYHYSFWRLLQAPYYNRSTGLQSDRTNASVSAGSSVAQVLEEYGGAAARVMHRYGLYCLSCPHANADNLQHAGQCHGLDESLIERMIGELAELPHDENSTED